MTSGRLSHIRACVFLLAGVAASAQATAADDRVAGFLATLAPAPEGTIPFVEKRMSALLAEPIELRGELQLGPDGAIDQRVFEPTAERVLVTARVLTVERDGRTRTIEPGGRPSLADIPRRHFRAPQP